MVGANVIFYVGGGRRSGCVARVSFFEGSITFEGEGVGVSFFSSLIHGTECSDRQLV